VNLHDDLKKPANRAILRLSLTNTAISRVPKNVAPLPSLIRIDEVSSSLPFAPLSWAGQEATEETIKEKPTGSAHTVCRQPELCHKLGVCICQGHRGGLLDMSIADEPPVEDDMEMMVADLERQTVLVKRLLRKFDGNDEVVGRLTGQADRIVHKVRLLVRSSIESDAELAHHFTVTRFLIENALEADRELQTRLPRHRPVIRQFVLMLEELALVCRDIENELISS